MKNWDADVWFSFIAVVIVIATCVVVLAGCADAKATATINVFGPVAVPTSPAPRPAPSVPDGGKQVVIVDVAPVETTLIGTLPATPDPVPFNPPVPPTVITPTPDEPNICEDKHTNGRGRGHGDGKHCKP